MWKRNLKLNPLTHIRVGPAQPIHIPSNADRNYNDYSRAANNWETHGGFYETPWEPRKTVAESEKDLQDLLQQSFDGREDGESSRDEIDMSQAVVEGFRERIRLLPHQITGRIWMTERESGKKFGGILAAGITSKNSTPLLSFSASNYSTLGRGQ